MKGIPIVAIIILVMVAAAPCASQKTQAPSSGAAAQSKTQGTPAPTSKVERSAGLVPKSATKKEDGAAKLTWDEYGNPITPCGVKFPGGAQAASGLTMRKILEKIPSNADRLDFLACIADFDSHWLISIDDKVFLHDKKITYIDAHLAVVESLISTLAGMRNPAPNPDASQITDLQARFDDVQTKLNEAQKKLSELETFRQRLCSAINFSLVLNGTSATPSGGELWSACH